MEENDRLQPLAQLLLPWYEENKRSLPWRQDRQPYHIWLSEIMLQQTRVEAVKGYYARFLQALPTVQALADCPDELLHKLWEGLGYYSRVRNLKKAARQLEEVYGGEFPQDYTAIRSLPGIGDYTAGAICSIAFDQKTPAVDGNVLRLFSRLTDDPTPIDLPAYKKQVTKRLEGLYPDRAGDFTQALMELGATVCGPNRKPDCGNCPCRSLCLAYTHRTQDALPVKLPKKGRRQEEMTVFILRCGDCYALRQRPNAGLLAGLWEFPHLPGKRTLEQALAWAQEAGLHPRQLLRQTEKKHIFTHIQWQMQGIYLEVDHMAEDFTWLTARQIEDTAALPTAFRQFWLDLQ